MANTIDDQIRGAIETLQEADNPNPRAMRALRQARRELSRQERAIGGDDDSEDEAPAKSASKADWVAYAVSQGADREEAESATKDALIEQYGGE